MPRTPLRSVTLERPRKGVPLIIEPIAPRKIGYVRVSTDDQTTALQVDAMARAGVDVVFTEEASGAFAGRPILAGMLAAANAGDTVVVWRLDRLGRSLAHLAQVSADLRTRGIHLRSICEAFDTATASGRLLYGVLAVVAEFEREAIRERTFAGMAAARRRGVHVGRPPAIAGTRLEEARRMLEEGRSQVEVARVLRVSRGAVQRLSRLPC